VRTAHRGAANNPAGKAVPRFSRNRRAPVLPYRGHRLKFAFVANARRAAASLAIFLLCARRRQLVWNEGACISQREITMKNLSKKLGLLLLAAAAWGTSSVDARAQGGGGSPVLAYGFFGNGLYGQKSWESPPFYALYPPVYYSQPVPRPYGYSPFGYPPGYTTPDAEPIQAKQIINPYVPSKAVSSTSDRTAAAPKVIINPYVTRRSQAALAARPAADEEAPSID
jgi:hypothetical protein